MKQCLLLLLLVNSLNVLSQETLCSHAKDITGGQQITYYQYPSMNKYDVKYIKLDLNVETANRFISGIATVNVRAIATLDSFIIELRNNMIVDSIYINGTRRLFSHSLDHIYVPLVPVVSAGANLSAQIFYKGMTNSNGVFAGTVGSNGLNYTATLSESYQAREWFPAKQILTDKIDSADLWFTTSSTNKVGSNGLLQVITPMPAGKVRYQWKERHPMAYYLPSFSVGNYLEYINYAKPSAMTPDSIPILHYIVNNPTYFASIKANLDKTPPFLEKMSDLFTLYPFNDEKYGHAHAGIGGGMEHQTMSTMAGFSSTLIAHELGHQWWGDNVTCVTWNHIWLNEGLASYCEYLMIEHFPALIPSTTPAAFMQAYHNSVMSQPGGSLYVPDASLYDEGRIFSGRLSYSKGAAVTHTLRFELGDTDFYQALKNYQLQFADSVATTNDMKNVAENVSGKNLTDFFNQWVYGEGYPTINVTFLKEGSNILMLRVSQTVSMPAVTPFFKGSYEFRITSAQGDTTVRIYLNTNNEEFRFNYSKTPTNVIIDPNNWVLNASGTITNGGVTLPASQVTLSAVSSAVCTEVLLTWLTTNEHNISRYEIEFSKNNVQFTKAGEVSGTNTYSDQMHTFQHAIPSEAPVYYYRLKIVDTLGNIRYSNTATVQINCPSVRIGPVPTTGMFNVFITTPQSGESEISIKNKLGQILYKGKHPLLTGLNTIPIPVVRRFSAGIYMITITANGNTITERIIRL